MRTIERTKRLALLGTIITVFAACGAARAENAYFYDLDSLAYMSTDIVRVTIVKEGVRVEQAYAGKSTKGDILHVALPYPKRLKEDDFNTVPLAVGDELVLFLDKDKAKDKDNGASETADQWPVKVKLIQDGKVLSPFQRMNPGPVIFDSSPESVKKATTTLKQFESDLNASIKVAAEFHKKLSAPSTPKDIPWLLEGLKERSAVARVGRSRDRIGELLSVRLANLHDYDAIDQAISAFAHPDGRVRTLLAGYATPQGRDYMLNVIGDAKQPMKKRIAYAHGLWNIGTWYHRSMEVDVNGGGITGEIGEDNGDFLKRIAQLAADNAADEPLCLAILRSLETCASEVTQTKNNVLTADLRAAIGVLAKQYKTTPSQHVKFAIELVTLRADRDAYKKLESPCGDVPFLLSPPSTRYTRSMNPDLVIEYEYATETQDLSTLSYSIVLERLDGPQRFEIPWKVNMRANTRGVSGGGSGAVDLPKGVPSGKYKVYLRMKSGDKTWVSYSFETQLPQPDAPQRNTE